MTSPVFGTIETYLAGHSDEMAKRVETGMKALFDPEESVLGPEVQGIIKDPHRFGRPLPAQAVLVQGCVSAFDHGLQTIDVVGEMGSGKTPIGCWISRALMERAGKDRGTYRVIVTCPNQLVRKWADHFQKIVAGCRTTIVHTYQDLLCINGEDRRGPTTMDVFIIPRDRGKLSYAWRPAVVRQTRKVQMQDADGDTIEIMVDYYLCPRCGKKVCQEKKKQWEPAGIDYFAKPDGRPSAKRICVGEDGKSGCGEQLWCAFNGTPHRFDKKMPMPGVAPRRCAPAEFIWRQNCRFDLYIADEVHELSGGESLQGQMFAWISARSDKTINATGTLSGGYAHNLMYNLWRTMPTKMVADGLTFDADGHKDFVKTYGVLQMEKKYVQDNAGQSIRDLCLGRGRLKSKREKALPGISPLLYSRLLLPRALFLRLPEMHEHLPAFTETVHSIAMLPEQAFALADMTKKFQDHAARMKGAGQPCRAWSAARSCFLRWCDRPWPQYDIFDRDNEGFQIHALHVPELSQDVEYPKERRLRRLIQIQKRRGRKCWVFTELTGIWDILPRYVSYLAKHGITATVLRTTQDGGPKPEDREEWIKKHTPFADVIISHPDLVKTGLDLYDHPTIIFAYTGYSTYTLRQASRRAWRLGQKKPCEVHYLAYGKADALANKVSTDEILGRIQSTGEMDFDHTIGWSQYVSIQSAALSLMAKKMEASLALEGDFSASGLSAMSDSTDVASQLAKIIAGKLTGDDPKAAMASYRKRLEELMPSLAHKNGEESKPADLMQPPEKPAKTEEPKASEPAEPPEVEEPKEPETEPANEPGIFGPMTTVAKRVIQQPASNTRAAARPQPLTAKGRKQHSSIQALIDLMGGEESEATAPLIAMLGRIK